MTPVVCRIKHDPDAGTYGDCVRACVATLLDLDAEAVPHFYHDNPTGAVGMERMREWLATQGLAPFAVGYPSKALICERCDNVLDDGANLSDILKFMGEHHSGIHYMLYGGTGDGDHVVVCRGGKIVHNPAWYGCSIIEPASVGHWQIVVLVRL